MRVGDVLKSGNFVLTKKIKDIHHLMEVLDKKELVFWRHKMYHKGFIFSWKLSYLLKEIRYGLFFEAENIRDKVFFSSMDPELAKTVQSHRKDMRNDGIKELVLFEAGKDYDWNKDYLWCNYHNSISEIGYCGKECPEYSPKNRVKGKCKYKEYFYVPNRNKKITIYV